MPVEYELNSKTNTVETRVYGNLSRTEYFQHPKNLLEDETINKPWRELCDMSDVQHVDVSIGDMKRLARIFKSSYPLSKMAIVVHSDLLFGLSRVFEAVASSTGLDVLVTRDKEEAKRFLSLGNR